MGANASFPRWSGKWRTVGVPVILAGAGVVYWLRRTEKKEEENLCEEYLKALEACMHSQFPANCQHEEIDLQNCEQRMRASLTQDKQLKPFGHTSL